jgi:hypothetical protein
VKPGPILRYATVVDAGFIVLAAACDDLIVEVKDSHLVSFGFLGMVAEPTLAPNVVKNCRLGAIVFA